MQYTQAMMMAQDRVNLLIVLVLLIQFQPDIITLIQQLERIITKICRQKMSILFNQTCINEVT